MAKKGTTKYHSTKQENKVAKEMNAKPVIGSGSLWGSKGDVRAEDYLIECKTTSKSFYSLRADTWNKIEREAVKDGLRIPVMCIDLENGAYRLAVFKYNDVIVSGALQILSTHDKSFRVEPNQIHYVVSMDSVRLHNCQPLRLVVVPWSDFLDAMNEEVI